MTETRLVNWAQLLKDLQNRGMSLRALERKIGISHNTLFRYRAGSEPNHSHGEKLIAVWTQLTLRSRDALPRIE